MGQIPEARPVATGVVQPAGYRTPECVVAAMYPDQWPDGHKGCQWPGYVHGVLGRVDVECACICHRRAVVSLLKRAP